MFAPLAARVLPERRRLEGLMRLAAIRLCAIASLVACSTGNDKASAHDASSSGSSDATGSSGSDGGSLLAIPLTGCPLDSYFAPVTIAGQSFTLILDTGSSDTAVALSSCTTCDVSPKLSAPAGSCSTQLGTQQSLGWEGGVCSETVSAGGEIPEVTMDVVGISDNVEFFTNIDCTGQALAGQPQYQGILGMGPLAFDTIGQASADAYLSELVARGVADAFGLLLCSVGGRVWFGGYDPHFATGAPQYTPLSMPLGWQISVSSLGLGSTNLGAGDPKSIVDTGTQFYSMPTAAFKAFMAQSDPGFTKIFGASDLGSTFGEKTCVAPAGAPTPAELDATLPPMTMTLPSVGGGSFTLSLPATASYLVPATPPDAGTLEYCLAIQDAANNHGYSILGGPLLRANITLFDLAHAQIGFVPQSFCH